MLQKIIRFSIEHKLIVALMVAALVLIGSYELTRLPIDAVPDITNNQVQIITVTPGLSATDTERLITYPVEQSCVNIPGMSELRSFSRFGLSVVTVVFHDNIDVYWARQQIAERLQQVKAIIPAGAGDPELGPVTTGLGEIYQYVVRPAAGYEKVYNPQDLRTIQDAIVRRRLLGTPGIADVSSFGGLMKQYTVSVKTERLQAMGVTMEEVFQSLEKNNQNTGGAYIEKGPTVLFIRTEGLIGSTEDIGNIVIRNQQHLPLRVRDVADVEIGHAPRYGALSYNDQGEVAGAVVMMLKGENSSAVIKRVKDKMEEIKKSLPEGVVIEPFLDRTKMVNNAISTVEENLAMAGLIVVFVLVFFFGNARAGLIVASVIPLSMLFAVIMMNQFGISGNLMSLGAIDFGLIIDGAVIIVEAVIHFIAVNPSFKGRKQMDAQEMDDAVSTVASKMMKSAAFGQIIILIVYLPILSLQGIEGKMFKPMAQTVSLAILGAFLLSLTYVPMMTALVLSKKIGTHITWSDRLILFLQRHYERLLVRILSIPKIVLMLAMLLFAGSIVVFSHLGGEFIPELEEGDFAVDTRVLTGSNINTSVENVQKCAHILLTRFPEVQQVVAKTGSGEIPTDPMPIEASDMMVILKDKKEWQSAETFDELAEKMGEALAEVPGVTVGFQFPVQMRFNELMTGARQDVVCKIFGENLDTLTSLSKKIAAIAETVDGAVEHYTETVTGVRQIVINYNRSAMARYGVDIEKVNQIVHSAFAGRVAGFVYEGERRYDLVVRLSGERRKNLEDVQSLLIDVGGGVSIPLTALASVDEIVGPNQVQRENTQRRIVVGFNVRGRDVQSIVEELQQKVGKEIQFPSGYFIEYGGAFKNLEEARLRLSVAVPVALALIFLLLYFTFSSMSLAALVFSAIPLSAIGGIIALWLRGMPFSISAGIGFIALFGIAVLDGIVLMARFNELKQQGNLSIQEIIRTGTRDRLRPVLIAAIVPALGFLPMAISNGAGAEVQRPLATVVIGGLISSTLLTLFVLPLLYQLAMKNKIKISHAALPAIMLLIFSASHSEVHAQQQLSLDETLQLLEEKNNDLSAAKSSSNAAMHRIATAFDLSPTSIGFEYGNVNSYYNDNRFTISQTLDWPGVYRHRKTMLLQEMKWYDQDYRALKIALQSAVKRNFYFILVLKKKEKLLMEADSLYNRYAEANAAKSNIGATAAWEAAAAGNQYLSNRTQLAEIRQQLKTAQLEIEAILQNGSLIEPEELPSLIYPMSGLADTSAIEGNPHIMRLKNEMEWNSSAIKFERSKLMPALQLGYYNMTINGWQRIGDTERFFDRSSRFATYAAGLSIPLFAKPQIARIKAAESQLNASEFKINAAKWQLKNRLIAAMEEWKSHREIIDRYETQILPNALIVVDAAASNLEKGNIDVIEWIVLVNQSIQWQLNYCDEIIKLNETTIQIEQITAP
jgi:cobalt-zinc-cadmium resistance protein CzcA